MTEPSPAPGSEPESPAGSEPPSPSGSGSPSAAGFESQATLLNAGPSTAGPLAAGRLIAVRLVSGLLQPGPTARFAALATLVTSLAVVLGVTGVPEPDTIAAAVREWGIAAPVAAMVATAALVLALVPRTLLAAAAGLLFGPVAGSAYLIAGAAVGALVAFGFGRGLGREFVAAQRRVRRLDRWLVTGGVLSVLALRLLPIAPFGLVSYVFGTSGVRLAAYLAGTVLGMLPSTIVYANLGAAATRPDSAAFGYSLGGVVVLGLGTALAAAWIARSRRASARTTAEE